MTSPQAPTQTLKAIENAVHALDDKPAIDIRVLDIHEVSSITDFLVIATGNSQPHLKALRASVEESLKEDHVKSLGSDVSSDSGWIVIDAFDVMFHLFIHDMRETYRLDQLWRDGKTLDIEKWLNATPE